MLTKDNDVSWHWCGPYIQDISSYHTKHIKKPCPARVKMQQLTELNKITFAVHFHKKRKERKEKKKKEKKVFHEYD